MKSSHLIACHDCDALVQFEELSKGERIERPHCDARLLTNRPQSTQRAVSLSIGAYLALMRYLTVSFPRK